MREYETLLIIRPQVDEERLKAIIEEVERIITGQDGTVNSCDVWGLRKLEYPIKREENGQYVVIKFKSGPQVVKELERTVRMKDDILRAKTFACEKEK